MGNYQIVVTLSYKGEQIAASAFSNLGDGTYQARIVLWPRWSEDPNIPYVFSFRIFSDSTMVASLDVNVFPR
jgi:hypothetical protein